MEPCQRPRGVARYFKVVEISFCSEGGRCQWRSDGERSRRDDAPLVVGVIRVGKIRRANAVRGARIDGAKAKADGKVGLCVGGPWDQERERGQFEPLVTVGAIVPRPNRKALAPAGSFLLRANCKDEQPEQPEPEQQKSAVEARHPPQRHTDQVHHLLDGVARSVLIRVPLVVRERVLDVSVPVLALDEELLECDLKDLVRAVAQPFVGRHRVTPSASACSTAADGARVDG